MGKTKSSSSVGSFLIFRNYGTWQSEPRECAIREIGSIAFNKFLVSVLSLSTVSLLANYI